MAALGGITPVRSAVLGVTFAAIKPKNLLLTLAAAGAISETGIPLAQELVVLGVFTVVATLGIAARYSCHSPWATAPTPCCRAGARG